MNTTEINNLLPTSKHPAYTHFSDGTVVKYYDVDKQPGTQLSTKKGESITFIHFDSTYDLDKNEMGPREVRFSVTTEDAAGNRRIARGIVEAIWAWEDNPV